MVCIVSLRFLLSRCFYPGVAANNTGMSFQTEGKNNFLYFMADFLSVIVCNMVWYLCAVVFLYPSMASLSKENRFHKLI